MLRPHRPIPLTPPLLAILLVLASPHPRSAAQVQDIASARAEGPGPANYELASRFAPYKVRKLLHSTRVSPRWIDDSDRFWYEWKSSAGTSYYLVDPVEGSRTEIFDNDRIAAELTRITRDPWDAQHLPIRDIRFIDEGTLRFEVESSLDEEIEGEEETDDEEEIEEQD